MTNYRFAQDLRAIREILNVSQEEFAAQLNVQQITISRNELGQTQPSEKLMEQVYAYAFRKNVQLNRLKEMLWTETLGKRYKLLFHGAKGTIDTDLSVHYGRVNNDFGQGFYTGESYAQSVSFVSGYDESSVYIMRFDDRGLTCHSYEVDQDWMLTIAYYRGMLDRYKEHPIIQKLIDNSRNCDYIVAPIADNRMFTIINAFIDGEITDEQCKHCLAATNLGKQYVFLTDHAIKHIELLERCYLSVEEKKHQKNIRSAEAKLGEDKVKLARIEYRGQGKYIDEILK